MLWESNIRQASKYASINRRTVFVNVWISFANGYQSKKLP